MRIVWGIGEGGMEVGGVGLEGEFFFFGGRYSGGGGEFVVCWGGVGGSARVEREFGRVEGRERYSQSAQVAR